jgi:hypothetical protein
MKYEYCIIGPIGTDLQPIQATKPDQLSIKYLTENGIEESVLKGVADDLPDIIAQFIYHLGENGWELVGSGICQGSNVTTFLFGSEGHVLGHMLYFKRQKQ